MDGCNIFQSYILIHLVCPSVNLGHGWELGTNWARTGQGLGTGTGTGGTGHGLGMGTGGLGTGELGLGEGHGRIGHGLGTGGLGTIRLCPNVTGTHSCLMKHHHF